MTPIPNEQRLQEYNLCWELIMDCRNAMSDDYIATLFEQAAADRGIVLIVSAEDFSVTYETEATIDESLDIGVEEDLDQYLQSFFVDCWLALVNAAIRIGLHQIEANRAAFEDRFQTELLDLRKQRANTTDSATLPTDDQERVAAPPTAYGVRLKN